MATTFRVTVADADTKYARQAVDAALAELAPLEDRLSRFVEHSDINRINRLKRDRSTVVSLDVFECLSIALRMYRETGTAFDIGYRSRSRRPAGPGFTLDQVDRTVRVAADDLQLDLGGIGKGFALDRMAAVLREWDILAALLCASTSTYLAMGPPSGETGWPVHFGPSTDRREELLAEAALSSSGRTVQADHIVDPRTGRAVHDRLRCWVRASHGATADALSTALMVMSEEETRAFCRRHPEVTVYMLPIKPRPLVAPGTRNTS